MNMVQLLFIGIAIGMANVIPGVSGSTMAVVFNIYDRFVNAITLNIKKLIENRRFVIPVVGGMALGVLLFSKLITVLYENFPVQTDYFFTGLIIGSIPMLFSFMTKKQDGQKFTAKKTISVVICALAGFAVLIGFGLLGSDVDTAKEISKSLPQWTFPLALHIFAAGFVGAIAMIIPGISGSLLMLIMGVYPIVMKSIPALFVPSQTLRAFFLLLPNGIGVLAGLLCGAWIVKTFLRIAPNQTYAVIFGLIAGSAIQLFPGIKGISGVLSGIACLLCVLTGIFLAYFSSKVTAKEETEKSF
ncbi:MAG: DUF368 domain-containing protein [Treponema berlinense]|uniref:DUF368 domain-containing protein n=1 Tax=Treponema berlinense TaxID=225004 RepID=UPI0023F53237|nr:DUF368 domain-containing protein [Treponema berlinense]MDD5834029.1 DUF368 domain-containing protein [Treponema berlinense]